MCLTQSLTAKQVLAILTGFGFEIVSQRGSHIKLVRIIHDQRQILTLPNHAELDTGTCKAHAPSQSLC